MIFGYLENARTNSAKKKHKLSLLPMPSQNRDICSVLLSNFGGEWIMILGTPLLYSLGIRIM